MTTRKSYGRVAKRAALTGTMCWTVGYAAERPNILLILSDDQGFAEVGAYMDFATPDTLGAKNLTKLKQIKESTPTEAPIEVAFAAARRSTPHVDRLASEGIRFTSFTASPTCAPTRAALMTARYPQQFGIYSNCDVEPPFGKGLPVEADVLVTLFQQSGYRTGLVGKWHLGSGVGQHPNDVGFEYYFGFDRAFTDPYESKILFRNRTNVAPNGWLEDQISNEAVHFLEKVEEDSRPFFLFVSYSVPRDSTQRPPQSYIDYISSGSDILDVHFGTIYGMDFGIGRILAELERTGEIDNTLIFFGSDNGMSTGRYHQGAVYRVTERDSYLVPVPGNGPLRGCKWTPWEGGVRVPFVARLPDGVRGQSSHSLQSIMDVLPTALEYAGIEIPSDFELDGVSFLPLLRGEGCGSGERTLFWAMDSKEPYGDFGPAYDVLRREIQQMGQVEIRSERHPPAWYVRTEKWKLMGWDLIDPVLIDIQNDISERYNLADQYPEVVSDLSKRFSSWFAQQAEPLFYPVSQWGKLKWVK